MDLAFMRHRFNRTSMRGKPAFGGSMVEFIIAFPVVLVACLLVLQLMLLYRAKIALNYATQEGARVGSMSNGRIVPRFLTDITRFSNVFRKKKKCIVNGASSHGEVVGLNAKGECPSGSSEESPPREVDTSTLPGNSASSDGGDGAGTSGFGSSSSAGTATAAPPNVPSATDANNAKKSGSSVVAKSFLLSLAKGMMRYGDSSVLQGFANGIMPLYTRGTSVKDIFKAQAEAYTDAMMNSCILYHNPTHAAFLDFGFMEVEGPDKFVLQIPNDMMRYRVPADVDPKGRGVNYFKSKGKYLSDEEGGLRGSASSMSVQEANLLSIEIMYSYPLQVPLAREILVGLGRLFYTGSGDQRVNSAFENFSFKNGRWPMSSFATYRMQTPVHWHIFYPFGDVSNIKTPGIEVFDAITSLWNVVMKIVNDRFDPAEPQVGFCPGLLIDSNDDKNLSDGVKNNTWLGKDFDSR